MSPTNRSFRFSPTAHLQTYAARAMPRRVVNEHVVISEREGTGSVIEHVDRWGLLDLEPVAASRRRCLVIQKQVVTMEIDGNAERSLGAADAGDVIQVRREKGSARATSFRC